MPALYTLWNTRLEKRWNVGSDDFVLPTILAISVRLVGFVLVVGVLVYLYVAPLGCDEEMLDTPPWLYGTLFATLLLEFAVVIDDAIIMSKSCRGQIDHSREPKPEEVMLYKLNKDITGGKKQRWLDPDDTSPRKPLKRYLFLRFVLFILEIVLSGLYGYACWSPAVTEQLLDCKKFRGPIYFARAVAVSWWVVIIISSVMWAIFLDPVGMCTPGLLDHLDFLDGDDVGMDPTKPHLFRYHRARVGSKRIKRRFKTLFCCCLGSKGHRERGLALEDAARAMQSIFNDVDLVGSDLVAGLILLNRDQKQKKRRGECLVSEYQALTFKKMSERPNLRLIPSGYDNTGKCKVEVSYPNFEKDLKGYILLDDLLHYCHYALGVYGWPLYVYDHMKCGSGCCGLIACCKLVKTSCGGCYCRRLARRKAHEEIIADNLCFCGFASVQLQSPEEKLEPVDIKHITFENEYFKCPYMLCVDHDMKAVVVCVRGTLSFKDALTDVTVSVKQLTKDDVGERFNVKGAYVHRGMYGTAACIRNQLLNPDKDILLTTLQEYNLYRLVIVGHSLGAGVASILAVLLKTYFPDLICYAYSPPGCVFSFPLVQYSKDFITSVVVGNDIVPRLSIRSLDYMKREIEHLLKNCEKPKHQVLFQPRWCDNVCNICTSKPAEEPSVSITDIQHKLFREDSVENLPGQATLPPRPTLNRADSIVSWGCCGRKRFEKDKKPAVKKVTRRQAIPTFAPGSILHLIVKNRQQVGCLGPCYTLHVTPEWMKSEGLGVIVADRGMIEDHMPTRVMEVLRSYHKDVSIQTSLTFTKDCVEDERKRVRQLDIRDLIQDRIPYEQPMRRGSIVSDHGMGRGYLDKDFDEPDGAVEETDGAVEETDGAVEETDGAVEETDGAVEETDGAVEEPDGAVEETDGAVEETDGAADDEISDGSVKPRDGAFGEEVDSEDGCHSTSPEIVVHKLVRDTSIDIEGDEDPSTWVEMQGGIISSGGGGGPEETEIAVEMYGDDGYTELGPVHTVL